MRSLLSNIAVTVQGGVVNLSGDTGDHNFTADVVTISSAPNLEFTGTAGTEFTFNNTTVATLDIPLSTIGTIKGLDITMQGGNDTVSFDATNLGTIEGNVTIKLGDGTNSLTFNNATATGSVVVTSGSGDDTIQMTGDAVESLSIDTGDGTDAVTLSTVTIGGQDESSSHDYNGDFSGGWWRHSWFGGWGGDEYDHLNNSSLNIMTGDGDDTVTLNSVTGNGSTSSGSWHSGDDAWWGGNSWCSGGDHGNALWQISLGSGTDSVSLTSVSDPGSVSIRAGSGTDTVNLTSSTIQGSTNVALSSGDSSQINVTSSTLNGKTSLSTGSGDSQSISVNDSTFAAKTQFSMGGSGATLNIENGSIAGPGTTFQASVVARLNGPSAVANLGGPSPNNTLTFEKSLAVFGGNPNATVNIATANTTLDDNHLHLHNANRVNV